MISVTQVTNKETKVEDNSKYNPIVQLQRLAIWSWNKLMGIPDTPSVPTPSPCIPFDETFQGLYTSNKTSNKKPLDAFFRENNLSFLNEKKISDKEKLYRITLAGLKYDLDGGTIPPETKSLYQEIIKELQHYSKNKNNVKKLDDLVSRYLDVKELVNAFMSQGTICPPTKK